MLSCYPAQHPPFIDFENRLGYSQKLPTSATFEAYSQPCDLTLANRKALGSLDNCCSPRSQPNDEISTHKSMQSSYSHQPNGYSPAGIQGNTYGTKDSGLGITTDENYFVPYTQAPSSATSQVIGFNHIDYNAPGTQQPLGSPFDEVPRNNTQLYNAPYPNNTTGAGVSPIYSHAHDQGMYQQVPRSSISSASMSPGMVTPYQMSTSYMGPAQFKRPSVGMRQNSSSRLSQQSFPPTQTPNSEFSGYQQTPTSATNEWPEQSDFSQSGRQLSEVVPENASCEEYDQMPYDQAGLSSMMMPAPRRKNHIRPSFSEACVPRGQSPARMRAASMGHFLQMPPYDQYMTNGASVQQLPLPPLPPSMMLNTPQVPAQQRVLPGTPATQIRRHSRSNSSTPHRRKRPSSPPASDFVNQNVPYLVPMKQDPTFPGDLYTPRYKRRTPNGRWEGWCGYCTPGRWLDLKNSRFWEDKLRNHGICAKTKMRFDEPVQIRWVSADGTVIPEDGAAADGSDPFLDQRKREGLCGRCHNWIGMDGLRTKARDRAVGWWMHAYKCHDHDKTVERTAAG